MRFKDTLPDSLGEYPNASQFFSVLDSLQDFKQEVIAESLRVNNVSILMDRKWLIKKLSEFGIADFPVSLPIPIIQQTILNVDTLCRTRGSKIGIELYCSLLSFGEVSIDDSLFFTEPTALFLDSISQGYIASDTSLKYFNLVVDSVDINEDTFLKIAIKSKYFNGKFPEEAAIIKQYIEATIGRQLGFSPNKKVSFVYESNSDFYFHKLLNPYFI